MKVCTAPHTGSVGSPMVALASRSTTHACVQYRTSGDSPVTATGASVPLPLVLGMLSGVVESCEELYESHGAYKKYALRSCPGTNEL